MEETNEGNGLVSDLERPLEVSPATYKSFCWQYEEGRFDCYPEKWWETSHAFMMLLRSPLLRELPSELARHVSEDVLSYLVAPKDIIGKSFCSFAACAVPSCKKSICTEHGYGGGCDEGSCDSFHSFGTNQCTDYDCEKYICWEHYENLPCCDVCRNASQAECSMGCSNSSSECKLCPEHVPVQCMKFYEGCGDEDDDDEEEEIVGVYRSVHDPPIEKKKKIRDENGLILCGFMCCRSCLSAHECGDDPREYC